MFITKEIEISCLSFHSPSLATPVAATYRFLKSTKNPIHHFGFASKFTQNVDVKEFQNASIHQLPYACNNTRWSSIDRKIHGFRPHMNLVLGDSEEFRKLPPTKGSKEEREDRRTLGLVLLRGEEVISMTVEGPPPPDESRVKATSAGSAVSGPGIGRAAGRGVPTGPLVHTQPGLTGPVRGVGGPAPSMMQPQLSRPPMSQVSAPPINYPQQPPPMMRPPGGGPPMPPQGMQMQRPGGPPPMAPPPQFRPGGGPPQFPPQFGQRPMVPPPPMMRGPPPPGAPPRPGMPGGPLGQPPRPGMPPPPPGGQVPVYGPPRPGMPPPPNAPPQQNQQQ